MIGSEIHLIEAGVITWVNGPVVRARSSVDVGMHEVLQVGPEHLVGEVISLSGNTLTIQVYEETSGLKPGTSFYTTGAPLSLELGPGLMSGVFDGIQRPLPVMQERSGVYIPKGIQLTPLYRKQTWHFEPTLAVGRPAKGGIVLGVVPETPLIEHRVMLPHGLSGSLTWIAPPGDYTLEDDIAQIATAHGEKSVTMLQHWPVRNPRPYLKRLRNTELLVTGQRVLDTFFPLVKGGAAAIPGGFGAGKTVLQHQVAKWSDADVIIYVGCGERGNEMADVLRQFPELTDPHSGHPLMERTILIANTSNMPVAAREASIYTGVTLAEYYRDMGYNVALMADSTSRWAEALREISGRLEEMPAEEGFPAYLPARLADFYERAGCVMTMNGDKGSVSLIGAVSPPGGDFSEPVTQHTRRFVRCFWALDKTLASERHFPSVNWLVSYSQYVDEVAEWWVKEGYEDWLSMRERALELLQRESHLLQISQLIGADALPDDQRLILETARLLRQGFLQQSALDDIDMYSSMDKQMRLLRLILEFHTLATRLINLGCPIVVIRGLPSVSRIARLKDTVKNENVSQIDELRDSMRSQIHELESSYK